MKTPKLFTFLDKIWNFGTVCCKMSRKMIFKLYIGNTYAPAPFFLFSTSANEDSLLEQK